MMSQEERLLARAAAAAVAGHTKAREGIKRRAILEKKFLGLRDDLCLKMFSMGATQKDIAIFFGKTNSWGHQMFNRLGRPKSTRDWLSI